MNDDTPASIVVRPSRVQAATRLGVFLLFMIGGALLKRDLWPVFLALAAVSAVLAIPSFRDAVPRLILAPDGLSWRETRRDPLSFACWDQIVSADIKGPENDDAPFLRLRLARPDWKPGERSDRRVDIPIDGLELSSRQLMVAIHRRAPHLFTRVSRREI